MSRLLPSPEQRRAAQVLNGKRTKLPADHPDVQAAHRDWRAEQLKSAARAAVATWPPLTKAQIEEVRTILSRSDTNGTAA